MKLTATHLRLLFLVTTQNAEGQAKQFPVDEQEKSISAYGVIKPFITKEVKGDQVIATFLDCEVTMTTEQKAFFLDQLKRPFDVESAEVAREVKEILND